MRSDDALDHEWRTDREGCIRSDRERLERLRSDMCNLLESYGVSTAQWAEYELNPAGTVFVNTARTMYAPPHGFRLPLTSGDLQYDHNRLSWLCGSHTCAYCRMAAAERYCERYGGGLIPEPTEEERRHEEELFSWAPKLGEALLRMHGAM